MWLKKGPPPKKKKYIYISHVVTSKWLVNPLNSLSHSCCLHSSSAAATWLIMRVIIDLCGGNALLFACLSHSLRKKLQVMILRPPSTHLTAACVWIKRSWSDMSCTWSDSGSDIKPIKWARAWTCDYWEAGWHVLKCNHWLWALHQSRFSSQMTKQSKSHPLTTIAHVV